MLDSFLWWSGAIGWSVFLVAGADALIRRKPWRPPTMTGGTCGYCKEGSSDLREFEGTHLCPRCLSGMAALAFQH
jgi:hypothetical protein